MHGVRAELSCDWILFETCFSLQLLKIRAILEFEWLLAEIMKVTKRGKNGLSLSDGAPMVDRGSERENRVILVIGRIFLRLLLLVIKKSSLARGFVFF
jgi:hypothetical protein